jgi:inosine-uridine nucleoside N-ribohydrolase
MQKVHLDTDLGGDIDDLCALSLLLRWPDVEVTGITTVTDENGKRAGYTRYVLRLAGREDIPVAAGADVALGCYRFKPGYPSEERYWPEPIPPSPGPAGAALDLLERSIEQAATVIGIGPYTNLRLLDERHPGILQHASIYLMGGYIEPPGPSFPQWDHRMDYNIQLDVHSAMYVLQCSNLTLVPLTITVETALRRAYFAGLAGAGRLGQLIARQAEAFARDWDNESTYGKPCAGLPDDTVNFQHDPLTCAIALGWRDGVEMAKLPLRPELVEGWLLEHVNESGKPTRVVTAIDHERFNQLWFDIMTASPPGGTCGTNCVA